MKFRSIEEVVKEREEKEFRLYEPKPHELDTWVPGFKDADYFCLDKSYASSTGIMNYFQNDDKKDFFKKLNKKYCFLEVGSLIHCHLLTPEDIDNFQKERDRIAKVIPKHLETVTKCVEAAKANKELMLELEGTERELAGMATSFLGGRARIKCDAISHERGAILDVKTTSKSSPAAFEKDVHNVEDSLGYEIQAAFYLRVANEIAKLEGRQIEYNTFKWLVVCKKTFKTGVVTCPPELIKLGNEKIDQYYAEKGWEK